MASDDNEIVLKNQLDEIKGQLARTEKSLEAERAARQKAEESLFQLKSDFKRENERILESEQGYKTLVDNIHDTFYSVTPTGEVEFVGLKISFLGYKPEELIGKNFFQFVAPEQLPDVTRKFETGTAEGQNFPTQFQFITKNNSRRWVEVVGNTLFDEAGIPIRQIGIMRDIEERKQQEEKERALLTLLDSLDAECFIKDKNGIYVYVNKAFEDQFGVKRHDIVGKGDEFIFDTEIAKQLKENDQRIMASRKSEVLEESGHFHGEFKAYLNNKTPIFDKNGEVTGICGIGVDITYKKEFERNLRASEEKYRSLVEQITEVIYSMDKQGTLTYVSPAVEAFLGYDPSEVIGKPFTTFIASDDLSKASDNFKQLSTGDFPGTQEYALLTKSGKTRYVSASSQPVLKGDIVVGVQGVLVDITQQKFIEKQIKQTAAAAERERLARELHDSVTQTLYSITAISEALPRIWKKNHEHAQEGLQEINKLTHAALTEMRTLLLELRPGAIEKQNLAELLHLIVSGLRGKTNIPVELEVVNYCSPPSDVQIGLYRITQESLNNIVKHSRAQQAQVCLDCKPDSVNLTISDDGVGFNPNSLKSHQLGLDIMQERAKEIGALLNIKSSPDTGTRILVEWKKHEDAPG